MSELCPKCGDKRITTTRTAGGQHICNECNHRWQDDRQRTQTEKLRLRATPNERETFLASSLYTSPGRRETLAAELAHYREDICRRIEATRAQQSVSPVTVEVLDQLVDEIRRAK